MQRKKLILRVLLCAGALALSWVMLSRRVPARYAPPSVVRLGYFLGGRTNLFGRAFADGCFDREGVNVELTTRWLSGELMKMPKDLAEVAEMEGGGQFSKMTGTDIAGMIARGELDGGLVGEGSFLSAVRDGKPLVAVAMLGHDRKDEPNHGIVLRRGITIKKPEDFRGLKFITRRAGPSDSLLLREFLASERVPEEWVTITDQVDNDRMKPMLRDGRADGAYMHLLAIDSLIRKKAVYVYRPLNWVNPEISLALLVFRRDFLEENRDLVEKIAAGYMKRVLYERSIPAEQRVKNKRGKGGKTAIQELDFQGMNLPVYDYPPKVRVELLGEMQGLMVRHGVLKEAADLGKFVDLSVVDAVLKRQAAKKQ